MENKAKLKGYKLNPNYTPSAGDYLHIADWDYGEIEELVAMTPRSWWYSYESKLKYGFEGYEILLFGHDTFGTAATNEVPWGANHITKSDILIPVEEAPVYNPENIVATCNEVPFNFGKLVSSGLEFGKWLYPDISQPKKEQPELKYTELWVADTSKDKFGILSGEITHGSYYDVVSSRGGKGRMIFDVVCDTGALFSYN